METIKVYFEFSIHSGRLLQFNKIKSIRKNLEIFTLECIFTSESNRFRNAVKQRNAEISEHRKPQTANIKDQP